MAGLKIVCATDLGPSGRAALDLALVCARDLKASITLLHVTDDQGELPPTQPISPAVQTAIDAWRTHLEQRTQQLQGQLQNEARRCEESSIPCKIELGHGRPWEAIAEAAQKHGADLVVVGPHAEGLKGAAAKAKLRVLGATADRVVRHSEVPVFIATGQAPTALRQAKWVVGTDFSEGANRALTAVADFARIAGGQLVVVHAISPAGRDESWNELLSHWHKEAENKLSQEAASHAAGVPTELHVVIGSPEKALLDQAHAQQADFVVVGTHGLSGWKRFMVGSVAEKCLRAADLPMLAVRGS